MNNLLLVFLGGGFGSVTRYGISMLIHDRIKSFFPWGTLTVNIIACFILGILTSYISIDKLSTSSRLLLATGFCGGFSTFSSFTSETMSLFNRGETTYAILYVAGSVALCLLAFAAGLAVK